MTRFLRGYLGALISALAVLFLHGVSRPYMDLVFTEIGEDSVFQKTQWIPGNQSELPQPDDKLTSGLWIIVGADKLASSQKPNTEDLKKLLIVAERAAADEPENSYWLQSSAVILNALGRRQEAVERWIAASKAIHWNDYQSERLLAIVQEIQAKNGTRSSWPFFATYPYREVRQAKLIERFARNLVAGTRVDDPEGLRIRYATLVNGCRMRDGAHSPEILAAGEGIIEMSSYPMRIEANPSQKALTLARYALINELRKNGQSDEAAFANDAFRTNDGWDYELGVANAPENLRLFTAASILAGGVPSALLAVSFTAAVIWAAGGLLLRKPKLQAIFRLPYAPLLGMIAGIAIYWSLHMAWMALAATAAFAFTAFAPGQKRSKPSEDLGPFFRFTLVVIAFALTVLLGGLFIGMSSPGVHLMPLLGVTTEYVGGSVALLGLAAIALGLLLLIAPAWGLVRKVPTCWVLSLGIRDLGKGLCLAAATLSVFAALAGLYVDSKLYITGHNILENEPVYYWSG